MDKLIQNIINECDEKNIALNDLIHTLRYKDFISKNNNIKNAVESNSYLVGKCFKEKVKPRNGMFPECFRYYRIINSRSSNEFRVECLIFDEYPTYWFEKSFSLKLQPGCDYLGSFDFSSFYTSDTLIKQLFSMEEISSEEYWIAAKSYFNRLRLLDWTCDHITSGGIWPHDIHWKK